MRRLALTLATVSALLLAAQGAAAKDTWTSVRSRNFFLIGNAGDKEIRRVATRLEQFRDVFVRLFPTGKFNSPVPTTVVVFKSHGSYKPFKPVVDGKTSSEVAGYFQPGDAINYITLTTEAGGENPFSTIYHEYVHLLLNNQYGSGTVPAWFNEGLAEYYSTFDVDDERKVLLGSPIQHHLYLLRQQRQLIPLKTLFEADTYSLHRNGREAKGIFYAQSWALVHYLIIGNGGQRLPQMTKFLDLRLRNTPTERAFAEAFQTDFASMEKELTKYVENRTFRAQLATFDQRLAYDSEMVSAPLAEAEAEAHLGDLLLHTDRAEDAAKHLQQALALDPKLGPAHASLGMVRLKQKRFEEARRHLRQAIQSDAQSYRAHYYYAYAISREGMDESGYAPGYDAEAAAEMRASLRKAVELKPDFAESYHLTAWVNLVTGEQLGEAEEMLRKALALSPGNERYAFILAQVYLREQKFDAARRVAEPLAKQAGDPQMRASAQSLLHALKTREEQEARFKAMREEAAAGGNVPGAGVSASAGGEPPRLRKRGETAGAAAAGKTQDELVAEAFAEALTEALRKPAGGETRARGVLLRIECAQKRLVFHVRAGDRVLKLQAEGFEGIHIMAFTREAGGQITCGERKPESHVVFTYRAAPEARSKSDGTLVALEFVPENFQLKQ